MNPQRAADMETLTERQQRLRRQINALRQKRSVYLGYGDPASGDRLFPAIAVLEQQLLETHKRAGSPQPQHSERR